MERDTPYRNITSSVRTPRYAVFINKADKYWKTYIDSIIQSFSQVWGGEYFLIIPTDGKTIDDKFWEILEAYSPDKLGKYIPNFFDLKEAEPKQYESVKEQYRKAWKLDDSEFEEYWLSQIKDSQLNSLEISKELSEELKNRLSPFYFQDGIVSENVFRDSALGFPFTQIVDIVEFAKDKPTQITIPKELSSPYLRLLASSRTGSASASFREKLKLKGFSEITIPDNFRDKDYVTSLEKNKYDFDLQKAISEHLGGGQADYPEKDFHLHLPFRLSMLYLGKFYRRDTHREEKENLHIIIGNEVMDFCLYYCLSRLHQDVYWIPDYFLQRANAKTTKNKNLKEGGEKEVKPYTSTEELAVSLVMAYGNDVRFKQKQLEISSFSLTNKQLELRRLWMGNICWLNPDEVLANVIVTPLADLSVNCVMRAIEANNHANQQDMIFQNGKSVGRVNTPKPKNFTFIDPANHRWITSLEVDGYCPPSLPFLGEQIIQLRQMSYETRVAKDGLAYLCPNIGHFGGDIDVNTVRPELKLLDETEIFKQYFAYSGYSMTLSDKGSYLKDTINRFGSLEDVAKFFKEEVNRKIFDQFLIKKVEKDPEVIYLDIEKRAYLSFDAFSRNLSVKEKAVVLLDDLIGKDIIRRGLIFQCSRCRLSAWYDIGEVSKEFKCKRCDYVQGFYQANWKSPEEPKWYYHLVETVYQFYDSNSHITALALDKIRQESKIAFHYICESDIINVLEENKKRELDILAISDGEIILGECKNTKPKPSDVTKYSTLFSQLTIKPKQFLLATTEESLSDEVTNALQKMKDTRVYTKKDLY